MTQRCGCDCFGHSCYCNEETCAQCGCRPKYQLINEARSVYCPTHSQNYAHGQSCPKCSGGE